MDSVLQHHLSRFYGRAIYDRLCEPRKLPRQSRVKVDGDFISYVPDEKKKVGIYIAAESLRPYHNYFEVEITETDAKGDITVGLVSSAHPLNAFPGAWKDSIGYRSSNGKIYNGVSVAGSSCSTGDFMGCGLKFEGAVPYSNQPQFSTVFFTKNGKEVGSTEIFIPKDGLFPAVCFVQGISEVRLMLGTSWRPEEDVLMCIDSNEEEWSRLHDIKLNGLVLEYTGRGKSIIDVGLAQAKYPLDTTHHYFEIEIVDPGENCYIAIGLARKDYPMYRHPGWNKGSIAYHADDGKIFVGSGAGDPFGPPCRKGDKMGCGIIFPRDFVCVFEWDATCENSSPYQDLEEDFSGSLSESDEEEWWKEKENIETGVTVQVFFTRNKKTIGAKDVCIPKGGFFPTVGMLSSDEKVRVDLHPLTG